MKLSITAKTMCISLGALFLVFLAAGLIVIFFIYPFEYPAAFALGLFAGTMLSAVKVILLERALGRALDMEKAGAKNYANLQMILRQALTIAFFACVFLFPAILGVFGSIIGVLSMQLAAYIAGAVLKDKQV